MKATMPCFLFFIAFLLAPLCGKSQPKVEPVRRAYVIVEDTTPKTLFVKIAESLGLRKRITENDKKVVLEKLQKMLIGDSLRLTARQLDSLNNLLTSQKKDFDILESIVREIREKSEEGSSPVVPLDVDMDELAEKISAILEEKVLDDKADAGRMQKLAAIHAVGVWAKDTATQPPFGHKIKGNATVQYKVQLSNLLDIGGVQLYETGDEYLNYNFALLNSLYCHAVQLEQDGSISYPDDYAINKVINAARKAGCRIFVTVRFDEAHNLETFLISSELRAAAVQSITGFVRKHALHGVNIHFDGLTTFSRFYFQKLMADLNQKLRALEPSCMVALSIPAYDKKPVYDLNALEASVDRFIILLPPLPKQAALPLQPLYGEGEYDLEKSIKHYLSKGISASRFFVSIPYYGLLWNRGKQTTFVRELPYREIQDSYKPGIEEEIDGISLPGKEIRFDGEVLLAEKYQFILENKLGGIVICKLGDDDGYSELWDELAFHFAKVDTIYLDTLRPVKPVPPSLMTWIKKKLLLYQDIFTHPDRYHPDMYHLDRYLFIFNSCNLALILFLSYFLVHKVRKKGREWGGYQLLAGLIIGLLFLFVNGLFMYMFLEGSVPWFGVTYGKEKHHMPFYVLMAFIGIGIMLGSAVMYFLAPYVRKQREKP